MRRDTYIAAGLGVLGATVCFFGLEEGAGSAGANCRAPAGSTSSGSSSNSTSSMERQLVVNATTGRNPNIEDKRLDCALVEVNETILSLKRGTVFEEDGFSFQHLISPVSEAIHLNDPRYAPFFQSYDAAPVFEIFIETLRRYPNAVLIDLHYEQFGAPFAVAAAQRGHHTFVATKHEAALCANMQINNNNDTDQLSDQHMTIFPDPTYIVEYIEHEVRLLGKSKSPIILKLQECHFLEGAIWERYDYDMILVICPVVLNPQFLKRMDLVGYAYTNETQQWRRWLGINGKEIEFEGVVYAVRLQILIVRM